MASRRFGRRHLLRGIGGIAVALPALEIMGTTGRSAHADGGGGAPQRYVYFFAAHVTMVACYGYDGSYPLEKGGSTDGCLKMVAPQAAGRTYDLAPALSSFASFGVRDDISIVSGLKIPWGSGSSIPPGGRPLYYHGSSVIPQTTGTRCLEWDVATNQESVYMAPTHDQLVADAIASGAPFRILNYGAQADGYTTGAYNNARISWRKQNGNLTRVDNVTSPQLAFQTLFSGFGATDPVAAARAAAMLKRRKSVLDLVDRSSARVLKEVGKADAERISRHFDEIRTLETRIQALSAAAGGACKAPADPGQDPESRGQEDARAAILTDLIAMAFACDLSRVATMQMVWQNSTMNAKGVIGVDDDLHNLSHHFNWRKGDPSDTNAPSTATVAIIEWQIKHYARLVRKLRDMTDFDGKTVLDNSALVMGFEGGYGHDPDSNFDHSAHSTENMCILVGGRAGGLKPGQHIVATDKHPASAVISAMNAVGCKGGLGEITDTIPQLFT
jgi:Protein of unknown function (DUF1552)